MTLPRRPPPVCSQRATELKIICFYPITYSWPYSSAPGVLPSGKSSSRAQDRRLDAIGRRLASMIRASTDGARLIRRASMRGARPPQMLRRSVTGSVDGYAGNLRSRNLTHTGALDLAHGVAWDRIDTRDLIHDDAKRVLEAPCSIAAASNLPSSTTSSTTTGRWACQRERQRSRERWGS